MSQIFFLFKNSSIIFSLSEAIKTLDDRSKDIIQRRFLSEDKVTLHDLAAEYSISAERVRQIENGALKKLKAFMSDAA